MTIVDPEFPALPKQTELSVSYSVGVKANIGNYESADAHVSRSEKWDVTGLTDAEVDMLYQTRYEVLHAEMGALIEAEYVELKS